MSSVARLYIAGRTPEGFALAEARKAAAYVVSPGAEAGGGRYRIAYGTRKRLRALHALRRRDGYVGNLAGWAEAIALIASEIGDVSVATVARHCRYVGIEIDVGILEPIVAKVAAAQAADAMIVTPRLLGELLQLTICERDELKIRSIDSCEETAVERTARLKRESEASRRRARGARPRSSSASATQPWVEAGYKTRRTWERNGKVPRMSQTRGDTKDSSYGSKGDATNLRHSHVQRHEFATSEGGAK